MGTMRKGYTCEWCQQKHDFPAWVFAHYDEELIHTCECGAKILFEKGRILQSIPPGSKSSGP